MKTLEEWKERIYDCSPEGFEMMEKIVEDIQKEAWNEAIDAAAENAKIKSYEYNNPYSDKDGEITYNVDKQSILKLKK